MSARFSRQSSEAALSGRGTAPPKRAPTPQRRHTLSSIGEIPPLPPRRVEAGAPIGSDSDSEFDAPRVRSRLPPTSGRGRQRSAVGTPAANGSLPASRKTTPMRESSPLRYLDGTPKPMIIKTMPFGRTNSQPVYSETAAASTDAQRDGGTSDVPEPFAGTYSSGDQLRSAHPPLVPHNHAAAGAGMPPLSPSMHVASASEEPKQQPPLVPKQTAQSSSETEEPEAPLYPTEDPPVASPLVPTAASSPSSSPAAVNVAPLKLQFYSPAAESQTQDSFDSEPKPAPMSGAQSPAVPPLFPKPPRPTSPHLTNVAPPRSGLLASPRPVRPSADNTRTTPASASAGYGTGPRSTRAAAASAATVPRGPPPLAPRTAVDDGWSGFSPRPELPGRRPPLPAGSARSVPREKPMQDSRHYTQSSRRPTQSVQTARERAAQRRRAASMSPTAHRTAGAIPQPEANTFPGAKRVEANDRVSTKHVVLLTAGVITAIVTAVVLVRAITRATSAANIAVPKTKVSPGAPSGQSAKPARRSTLPVLLKPPVGARPATPTPSTAPKVKLSSTGENTHEVIADIRERVIGALVRGSD